ncbi:MAG: penicillin-binding protein activator LpoB [Candidatus Accumulibacter sp.]|jgi:hypothetical protein|nr:penicillin-binding protein activator LpoB [Accumulibacter sp.]
MKLLRSMTAFCVTLCLLQACATREEPAYYVNEMGEVSIAEDDLSSELRLVAGAMTHAMIPTVLSGKNMRYPSRWAAGVTPLAVIVEVDNRTGECVDSRRVTDAIRTALRAQGTLRVLDDELPLPDPEARRSVPPDEEKPGWEALAIPGEDEPSPAWQFFRRAPLQPASARMSERPSPRETPFSGEMWQGVNTGDRIFPLPLPSPEPNASLPSPEADGTAPVGMSLATPSPNASRLPESKAQKRERMRRLLEAHLKEQDVQGYAPAYAIRTVLLPLATHPSGEARKDTKETYLFKMLVEDVRSETLKWASAWEVRKTPGTAESAREAQ